MNQKTLKQNLMCKTCSTTFATVKEKSEHQFSLMHHIRMDQAEKGTVSHSCSLCCLHIGGLKNYVAHLDGKKHKANLAKIDTLMNNGVLKNKKMINRKSGSPSLSKKQGTPNSNQIKEVSSLIAKPNNKNDASFNKTGNDQVPVHVTSHTSNDYDFSGMQHWTEHNSDFSSDDYYGGWNFSSTQYQNYPQFYMVNNWDQQNYNNKQSLWYNGQLNEYPQENHHDVQHSFDTNNCKSTQNRYFVSRNKIGSPDFFNSRFSSKENCNNSKKFWWYKSTNEKSTSLQTSRSDKSLNGVNSRITQNVNSKNKYHEENVGNKNNFSNNKHNVSSKATVKHPYESIALSGTSNNGTVAKKARLNKVNFSSPKSRTRNVNKSNDNITLSLKEQTLLNRKSKSVANKTKPTSKQDKLNLPGKNIKVSKTIDQKRTSRRDTIVPLNKHIKFPIITDAKNTKPSVSSTTDVNVVAGIKDSNYNTTSNLQSDRKEDTERNNSKQQLDQTFSVLHSTKLHKLSQILEESKLDFCPFDKELINKLVNFPRSRKEQLQLGKWIQEHSRTKKKLTLPRFNLQLVSSQNAKNQHEESSDILHSVVSEVVNNLQENVIDSLLLAIKNAEGSILQNTEDNKNEHTIENPSQNFPFRTEKNKDLSPNLHSGQLSYAEKIQWLQNWITEAYKPQTDHFSQRTKNNANQNKDRDQCLPCSSEVSREKNTDVHSFQTSNFNKVHTVSKRSISSDDTVKDTFSVQSDVNKSSSKAVHNEKFSEIPTNSVEVKQEVISENEDSTSNSITAENDNNLITKSPVSYPQNTKHLASTVESNFQVSCKKHASANSPTENCRSTKQHMSQFSLNSFSNACSEVPSDTASINVSSENQNLSNIIKTEPENTYDAEAVKTPKFSHNVGTNCNERDTEKISFSNTKESVQSDGDSDGVSFDAMVNSFLVDSSSNSFTINHVKEMLNKNKTLLQQITEVLNSHTEHSNTTESSNQNLIQEILATSQKEEELRLLGSKIERIISYFFRFAQEWKEKRTQAFYEEMRLRTRRIQLLERLKGQYPSTQNSPDHSKAADNLSGHTPPTPKSEASIFDQSKTSTHSHSRTVNINSSSISENESQKVSDFTGDTSNHPTVCATQNTASKGKSNCVDRTNKKIAQEKKKRLLLCDNNSQSSSDTTDIHTASTSSGNETGLERIRHKRAGSSAEGVDSAPRTLAEENERFWTEMENWLQDMGNNSSSPGKQGQFSQETEPEAEIWPEHIPIPSSDCSVKYTSSNSSHQGTSFIKETAFATEHQQAHKTSVLDIKVYNGYLYSCSSDATAKRFDLKDPTNVVLYNGHQKTITSLQITDFGNNDIQVFTSSMDGHLRCFDNASGRCLNETKIGFPIICTTEGWGRLYLGLPTGIITLYSLTTKNVIDYFQCSKCAISYIATSTEGAQKILCVASYDGAVTIWDATTGLLLRCLEGQAKPPCTVKIAGDMVYTSSTNMTVLIHNLSSGKLHKILNWPTSATGLHVMGNYIISCSYDGMVRCYTKKEWILHAIYYGAGKSSILCMCVFNDWVFTGNRHGLVEAFRFNPSFVVPCQYGKCYFRFGRLEDLSHHLKTQHFSKIDNQLLSCAWRGCDMKFSLKTSNQEKEDHVLQHVKSSRPILTDTCT